MSEQKSIYKYMDSYKHTVNDRSQKRLWINQTEMVIFKRLINLAYENGWRFVDKDDQLTDTNQILENLDTKLSRAISTFVAAGWLKPHIACQWVRKDQFLKKTFSEYEKNKNV